MHKDLLIIGGGLAGLTAALEASVRMPHWQILIVEKTSQLGGNSAKASSGVNAALNTADVAAFTQDTLASGGGVSNPQLVQLLTSQSQAGKSFLMEETQVELNIISQLGGHSAARTFRNEKGPNVGRVLIQHLQKRLLQQQEQVQVQLDTSVSRLVVNQSKMAAVAMVKKGETKEELIETDRVILATGGFSSSVDLLRKHVPAIADFPTTNGDWASGDGLQLTEAVGASFVHLDQVQLHPTGFVDPKNPTAKQLFLAPEAIRGSGALLVNQHGERFVNELEKRDVVSQAILRQPTKEAFLILFQQGAQLFGTGKLNFYVMKGLAKHVNGTLTELAAAYQFEYDTLARTLTEYNSGTDPFGKTIFPSTIPKFSPESNLNEMCFEAFVMRVRPVVHYCMGGVQIDQHARVLSKKQTVIDGLYAAGEVTGGVHGKNRLGGNSLAECIVFGRISAQHAVHYSPNN